MLNRGEEDYIKSIYKLGGATYDGVYVKTKALMIEFGHSLPSVNEMIKRIGENGFLEYKPYVGVKLTKEGFLQAEKLIKKHRLWEFFLSETLGLPPAVVHDEAEKLEHATSDLVLDALYVFLNKPEVCPHGRPIPETKEIK